VNFSTYSHCAGSSILPEGPRREIASAIEAISVVPGHGAAPKIRDSFLASLRAYGWSGEVPVSRHSDITITSLKNEVGLCLQTGNMARIYADLIKLQSMYLDNSIKAAAIVVPSYPVAVRLGSNIVQAQRLERELEIFKKAYHVPSLVFALE
jgi:hypothetical protein